MSFFKAYDMRGIFEQDFTLEDVRKIGAALVQVASAKRVLVGRDARTSSPAIRDALVAGLASAGAEVTDLGFATTPMVYYFTARDDFDLSIQITASHNPPEYNGLKVSRRGALPMGYDSGLNRVEELIKTIPAPVVVTPAVHMLPNALNDYITFLKRSANFPSSLRFAVDCSDGMASLVAHELFGANALYINDKPDGNFPHHAPNPLEATARKQAAELVRREHLDFALIFDGDADRVMVLDENGDFIQPDYLIPVLADAYGERGKVVIHDVRTSRAVIEALKEQGYEPVMGKVGHAFAKVLLRECKAVCGGELAGHYYIRDFFNCDSGELAALKMVGEFAKARERGQTVSEFMRPITSRYANSGELNFRVADKPATIKRVIAAAERLAPVIARNDIDGMRLEFVDGWISVRESNTEPLLRLLIEATSQELLDAWRTTLVAEINDK